MNYSTSGTASDDMSCFVYMPDQSAMDFYHPHFVPEFLSLHGDTDTMCGTDLECLYDLKMTGSQLIAENTRATAVKAKETSKQLSNMRRSISNNVAIIIFQAKVTYR